MMKKIFYFLICAALFACTDDETFTDTPEKSVFMEETVLAMGNDFHDIDIPGGSNWEVSEHPSWAVPMKYEGMIGTPLQLFVETNDEDEDRRDTLLVELANGSTVTIPLRQHGLASSDENSDITINAKALNQVYGVGYGVDVVDKSLMTGIKYNVKNASPFNFGNLQQIIEKKNWDDVIIDEPIYSSRYETVTGNSTDALSNQLGINAGIEVGIKAFKFSVEAGYSSSSTDNSRYSYAMLEMQHIVGSRYFRGGTMRYLAEHTDELDKLLTVKKKNKMVSKSNDPSLFQPTFYQQVAILNGNSDETKVKKALWKLVNTYGTHVISRGTLGGELHVSMQKKETDSGNSSSIHAALAVSAKVLEADGSFNMNTDDKAATANTTISLRSYGGTNTFTIGPGTSFEGFMEKLKSGDCKANKEASIDQWAESIRRKDSIMVEGKKEPSLAIIDMETVPLWDLMPNEKVRTMVHNFIVKDYQDSIAHKYGGTFTPDLFLVKNYDVTTNAPGRGSVYIPEIDLQIDIERCIIPELDEKELSTVIYSGQKDQVDRTHGFFVGSSTRKPCKFHREKNGKFTTEVFERLTKAAICELYVDVTGDITIATKSIDEMYVTCDVKNWAHDLGLLTKDWTFDSNITVTGSTNHNIHIADGKTLTLDNVTVNNQIICDGNANIVLKDGTKNTVKTETEDKAAIQPSGEGKTLTISGNGSLTAEGGWHAPGIGSSWPTACGNIKISGGTITANGGDFGPGIGSGWQNKCGDITITGGTIVAIGGTESSSCAGIGSSGYGICGNIIISGGYVTAEGTPFGAGIGTGYRAKCHDITISGGTVMAIGGRKASGIGSGLDGDCGNITITNGVEKVTALGGGNCGSIGKGEGESTCGVITIEDQSKVDIR